MALPKPSKLTELEYLAFDLDSDIRYEYADGEIKAMSGASREHNIITLNTSTQLNLQLRDKPCEIYQADMRVQVHANRAYRYPDIVVVCETPRFAPTEPESLQNPTVLIEVLSESTEKTDRIQKFLEYRTILSVKTYVLISQSEPRVESYQRQSKTEWLYTELSGLDAVLELPSIHSKLKLSEIYQRIQFSATSHENDE